MVTVVKGAEIDRSALIIVDIQNDFLHPDGGFAHIARVEHNYRMILVSDADGRSLPGGASRRTADNGPAVRRCKEHGRDYRIDWRPLMHSIRLD